MLSPADAYEFEMPIEAGQAMLFLRAIGSVGTSWAELEPGACVPALTFLQTADQFDPRFDRRPVEGKRWMGSGREPTGIEPDSLEHKALLHVDQRFTYERLPRVGEWITVRRLPPSSWRKQGKRGGELEFIEWPTEFYSASGELVSTSYWRDVRTEGSHMQLSTDRSAENADKRGDIQLEQEIVTTQLVMYVGCAGDFHPLHHDSVYVWHRGYPSVFVPGMLTMAIAGRELCERVAPADVVEFGARFRGQVWPGDALFGEVREDGARLEIDVTNAHGGSVLSAYVTTRGADVNQNEPGNPLR